MVRVWKEGSVVRVETEKYLAAVQTEGYVSGVMGGSFVDKKTGSKDLGFGLAIIDFLLEPGVDDEATPENLRYPWGDKIHGNIPKRYVELPQICTQARKLPVEVIEGENFVAVKQWFKWTISRPPYKPGSLWEQLLVFPERLRWFFVYDKVTSVNTVERLLLRMDMPGHIRHQKVDTFRQVYLSYHGLIPADAFIEDFAPDEKFFYRREDGRVPEKFIRAYQLQNGVWLAGMALHPPAVYEAWCHQRGYVCFIQEIGGWKVQAGESFGAVHLIGYFDSVSEMERVFDTFQGATNLKVSGSKWQLD